MLMKPPGPDRLPASFMLFLRAAIFGMCCLVTQFGAAQFAPTILKLQDQAIFSQQGSWVYTPLGDEPAVIQLPGMDRVIVASPLEGKRFGFRSIRDGFIWDIRKIDTHEKDKAESRSYLYRYPEWPAGGNWERVAELDMLSGIPHYLVPIDREGWFLGIGPYTGFFKEGRASHVALFRQQNDRIVFEDLVEMPFGERSHIGELELVDFPRLRADLESKDSKGELRKSRRTKVRPVCLTPDLWLPAILPDYLVLGASKPGVLWFFSLKSGQCQRTMDLGNVDAQELDKLGHLDHFLLAAQPDNNHRLLVVTRRPQVISHARSLYSPPGTPVEIQNKNHIRFLEIMEENTEIQWWAINPETWSKERIDDPVSFPEQTVSFAQQGKLRFVVGPDGRVHVNTQGSWQDLYTQKGISAPVKSDQVKNPTNPKGESNEVDAKPTSVPKSIPKVESTREVKPSIPN